MRKLDQIDHMNKIKTPNDLFEILDICDSANILFGAGISAIEPSCAPVWTEMLRLTINSMSECIQDLNLQNANINQCILKLLEYKHRPEYFWNVFTKASKTEYFLKAAKVLSAGKPNINHHAISHLFNYRRIKNIITTNYDEYLERAISGSIFNRGYHYAFDDHTAKYVLNQAYNDGIFFKIHGTLSYPHSIQYTMNHCAELTDSKYKLLKIVCVNDPLIICGYSGFDDDLFPALKQIITEIPCIYILSHPFSSDDEPIKQLSGHNIFHLQHDIASSSEKLRFHFEIQKSNEIISNYKYFLDAAKLLDQSEIAYIFSNLFDSIGYYECSLAMAQLCESICDTSSKWIIASKQQQGRILSIQENSKSVAILQSVLDEEREGNVNIKIDLAFSYIKIGKYDEANFILTELFNNPVKLASATNMILVCWYLARVKRHKQEYGESLSLFEKALKIYNLNKSSVNREIYQNILIDKGVVLRMVWETDRSKILFIHESLECFIECYTESAAAKNYFLLTKSAINTASIMLMMGDVNEADKYINGAMNVQKYIDDLQLSSRFMAIISLRDIIKQKNKSE